MTMVDYETKLDEAAKNLLEAQERDTSMPDYRKHHVKDLVDGMSVKDLRAAIVSMRAEQSRLSAISQTISDTRRVIEREAGLSNG